MGATAATKRKIADSQFGAGATSHAPGTWYQGVSTTVPNEDGTGFTEPVGGAYARVAVLNNATNFPAATTVGGSTTKGIGVKVTYPNPTGSWGPLQQYGWFETATGGTPSYFNALNTVVTPTAGNAPVEFEPGQLVMPW